VHIARIPVETSNLCIGMYVAMLDRPWLETPFVFQGFIIKDRFEIEQLQACCQHVFVDVDKGSLTEAQIRALAEGKGKTPGLRVPASGGELPKPGFFGRLALRMGLGALFAKHRVAASVSSTSMPRCNVSA